MEEVIEQGGDSNTAGADRAATAAWKLFEPMQFGMHSQAKVPVTAPHGLAGSIATAMAGVSSCAEMAMLWTEVWCAPAALLHHCQGGTRKWKRKAKSTSEREEKQRKNKKIAEAAC